MAIAVGPNNLAFDYKNGKSDRERRRERERASVLPRPLLATAPLFNFGSSSCNSNKNNDNNTTERNPPHIAHDVNVVVAFKNFVLMCLLQAASLFFVNPLCPSPLPWATTRVDVKI